MAARWSRAETDKVIGFLKAKRELWDMNDPAYQVRRRREEALDDILSKMQDCFPNTHLTSKDIRNKIHSLRSQYRKVLRTIVANRTSTEGGGVIRPSLWFFDKVGFLRPFIELKHKKFGTLSESDVDGVGGGVRSSLDEMDTDADTHLSPTVEETKHFMKPGRKRSRIKREEQNVVNREKRHRKKLEIANNFLGIFEEMDEVDSVEKTQDFQRSCSSDQCRRRRQINEDEPLEAAVERRHREKIEVANRFLDIFQQMVDKM